MPLVLICRGWFITTKPEQIWLPVADDTLGTVLEIKFLTLRLDLDFNAFYQALDNKLVRNRWQTLA